MTSETAGATSPSPTVGVVTVAYRSDDVLPGFLGSLAAASAEKLAIVVVDNAPESGTAASLAARAGAQWVPRADNPGYGGGMNTGVDALPPTVRWVLISNPDVVLEPGALDVLVATGESDETIGAVGPAVLNDDGTVYPSARAVPSLRTGVGHALFVNLWQANPWTRQYRQEEDSGALRRDAGWLSGSCVLVRRSAFERIGGFDEGYFMYFEDVDLGYRLGRDGYRNVYEPAARVAHAGAHATTAESGRMIAAHHASARRFLAKKYAAWHLWPVRAALSTALAVRSAIVRRHARTPRT
jgi:N-acetylglucosaminyl-diphospho-decaprenol L-rhamnosyltransferase